jgi:hypothetical protein
MSVDLIGRDAELRAVQARVGEVVALQTRAKDDETPFPA